MQNIEQIYKEYSKMVNKYLFCLTRDSDVAEELTQETFYKAIKKLDTYRGESKISVWLCQIAKSIWYNELKKRKRIIAIEDNELINLSIINDIEEIIIEDDTKKNLYKEIDKLEEPMKKIIYLRIVGEMSFKEISQLLGKSENWARVNFYRAKQKLKGGDFYENERM